MSSALAATLLLLAVPTLTLVHLTGRPRHRWARVALGLGVLAACLAACPWQGLDLQAQQRYRILVLAAALGLVATTPSWPLPPFRRRLLVPLAGFSLLLWSNFFAFHGAHTFVHLHDVFHYYLGAKYFPELDYGSLYTAVLRSEAERNDDHFLALYARDLETNAEVHIRELLVRSDPARARFSPERWHAFTTDVAWFRNRLAPDLWAKVLLDHGFNPPPTWALLGAPIANLVPAGHTVGIRLLVLLDPVLLALTFAFVGRAFGRDVALFAIVVFTSAFGATFGWTGGAFLRSPWLLGVLGAASMWQLRRFRTAGALLGLAAATRVFPVLLALPLCAKAFAEGRSLRMPPRFRRFFVAAATTGVLFVGGSLLLPGGGLERWQGFVENMRLHMETRSPNVVGSTELLAYRPRPDRLVTQEELDAIEAERVRVHRWQLLLLGLPLALLVGRTAARRTDLEAFALGLPLLWAAFSLASYYWVLPILLLFPERRRRRLVFAVLALELVCTMLALFEDHEARLYLYRSAALGWLWVLLLAGRPQGLEAGDRRPV